MDFSGEAKSRPLADERPRHPGHRRRRPRPRAAKPRTSRLLLPRLVALIQRGTCTFEVKVANATAAGYAAVVFFNEGQPGRQDAFVGTIGIPAEIPVVMATSRSA